MKNIMVFTLGGQSFGVESLRVESILRLPEVKPPEEPIPNVLGLTTIHGREARVFDAYGMLHLPPVPNPLETVVAMNLSDHTIAVIPIDHADGIINAEDRQFTSVPPILANVPIQYIDGVVSHEGKLILILNPDAF